jgi:hypothetical protein
VRLTHDLQEFDRFYDRFHSPMVERRFGASGILQPRPVLRRRFRFGGLLWIERQGRSIAGDVFETSNGSFNVLVHGEHAGLDPAETGLANRAAYVYGTEHARRLGCRVVNLGGSLPSLTNGVVRHKCAWGARITPRHETHVALLVGWKRPHPGVLRFLARHVPVIFDGSHLAAVTALEDPGTGGPRQAGRLLRKLAARGLGPLIVVSQNGWMAPERGDVLPGKARLRLIDAGSSAAVLAALSAG